MAKPKVDAAALQKAIDAVQAGRSPVDAAREAGIGKTRLYDEIKARKVAPPTATATRPGSPPARPRAPTPRRGSMASSTSAAPDRWVEADEALAPPEAPGAEAAEGSGEIGDLASLVKLAQELENERRGAPIERKGPLTTALRGVYADIRRARGPKAATPEELELLAGPDAAEVTMKLETAVSKREAEAAALGLCLWCRAPQDLEAELRAVQEAADPMIALQALAERVAAARARPAAPA